MVKTIGLLITLLGFASNTFAATEEQRKAALLAQPNCDTFVQYDDENLYLGFGYYKKGHEEPRFPIPSAVKVVSIADPTKFYGFRTEDGALDAVRDGDSLYILTFTAIEEFDLKTGKRIDIYPTTHEPAPLEYMKHARGFARYGNTLVIAHGRLGLTFFDMKSKMTYGQTPLVVSRRPHESTAMDVQVVGHHAIIVLDSFTLPTPEHGKAFQGIVVYDLEKKRIVNELDGLDGGADAIATDGSKLIVSYRGIPIWKYSVASLINGSKKLPNPMTRVWKFPLMGHPVGKPFVDETSYLTCFVNVPDQPGGKTRVIPQALDRKAHLLD